MTYYPPCPVIETELGKERLCRGCDEYWPIDAEFWYYTRGKIMGRCRACWSERSRDRHGRRTHRPMVAA